MIKKLPLLIFAVALIHFLPLSSEAGLRGLPEGAPAVGLGSSAPLNTEELKKANKEGKVILLMFGNPDHCVYCERVWRSVSDLQEQYEKDAAGVLTKHRASKFWGPVSESVALGETYGVIGEPWLFLIDKKGIIRRIFRGFVEKGEIEKGLKEVLRQ
ncbi:MAG: thioredoxin family protein [Deltaproteobacteria bacterium]|nr:thioredoxin family protein [Deltaproteobacteria bacterium]